jgi:integrase
MALVTNVHRRGSIYHFRVRVPVALRYWVGRKELSKSLQTSQAGVAKVRAAYLSSLTESLWRALASSMTLSEAKVLIDAWLNRKLEEDADIRDLPRGDKHRIVILRRTEPWLPDELVRSLTEAQFQELIASDPDLNGLCGPGEFAAANVTDRGLAREGFEKQFRERASFLMQEDDASALPVVKAMLAQAGVDADESDEGFKAAVRILEQANRDLVRAIISRDEIDWRRWAGDDPAQSLIDGISPPSVSEAGTPWSQGRPRIASNPSAPATRSLSVAAREAIPEIGRMEEIKAGRMNDYAVAVRTLIDWLGHDPDLAEITSEVAGQFKLDMTYYPSNASKRLPYRDLPTFAERLAAAKATGETGVLSAVTINGKYLTPLRRIYAWQKSTGRKIDNPFDGIHATKPKHADPKKKRRDFTNAEVAKLFSQPLFVGSHADSQRGLYRTGTHRVADWRFWVALIGLFSGMRLNEVCGLALVDFKTEGADHYMHVRDEIEEQSLKSGAARRKVPVHRCLIEIGLIQHVERLRKRGAVRLFDELQPDTRGYYSGIPSKFYDRMLDRIVDPDPDDPGVLTFHSARHTVISRLRAAEVREDVAKDIVGHDQNEVHGGYGKFDIATAKAAIDKITYPGLDLSRCKLPEAL